MIVAQIGVRDGRKAVEGIEVHQTAIGEVDLFDLLQRVGERFSVRGAAELRENEFRNLAETEWNFLRRDFCNER